MGVHAKACSMGDHGMLADSGMGSRVDSLGVCSVHGVCRLDFAARWWAFWHAIGHGEQVGCVRWSAGVVIGEGATHAYELTRMQLVMVSKACDDVRSLVRGGLQAGTRREGLELLACCWDRSHDGYPCRCDMGLGCIQQLMKGRPLAGRCDNELAKTW